MKRAKPEVMQRQMDLLRARYDLSNRPAKGVTMSRGKPIQEGVRITLPKEVTWEKLATLSPEEIREKEVFPAGFLPFESQEFVVPYVADTRWTGQRGEQFLRVLARLKAGVTVKQADAELSAIAQRSKPLYPTWKQWQPSLGRLTIRSARRRPPNP